MLITLLQDNRRASDRNSLLTTKPGYKISVPESCIRRVPMGSPRPRILAVLISTRWVVIGGAL